MTESEVRSALKAVDGVKAVDLSIFADIYTLTFEKGVTPDEKTIRDVFQGCQFNGRTVVVEQDRAAVADIMTSHPAPPVPEDNPGTPSRVALGKKLFFDTRLSAHGKMSCATCHEPKHGFAFPEQFAPPGFNGQRNPRNVPTIVNVAYRKSLLLDGRAPTLEKQALVPIEHPAEMGMKPGELAGRLAEIAEYAEAFRQEFGGAVTIDRVTKAIAAYERTVRSDDTPFDRYARGQTEAIGKAAHRGYLVFRDKANCITCHSGPDFTDGAFRVIGIGWDGKGYQDPGRAQVTGRKGDAGKFRVPTLRELRWTAPYMHDGSMSTLAEVVEFYNLGGHQGVTTDLHGPLKLTDEEKQDLVAFLESLSSDSPPAAPILSASAGGSAAAETSTK